jgi:hypothetical protein
VCPSFESSPMSFRVSKDSKGFEDIESFWKASGSPFVLYSLFERMTSFAEVAVEPIDSSSSDEFLYDTSSSISGE